MTDAHDFTHGLERMLGLNRPWNATDLQRQHRAFLLKWHPDRNPGPESHARMARANHARDVLRGLVEQAPEGVVGHAERPWTAPSWEDWRHKGGSLWWNSPLPNGTELPPGWARASKGKRPGQPWTKRPGAARDLVAELERWMAARASA